MSKSMEDSGDLQSCNDCPDKRRGFRGMRKGVVGNQVVVECHTKVDGNTSFGMEDNPLGTLIG